MPRRNNTKKGIQERRWKEKQKQIDFMNIEHEETIIAYRKRKDKK